MMSNTYYCENCKDKNFLILCTDGCGKVMPKRDDHGRLKKYAHRSRFGVKHHNWKGGRYISPGGYWFVRAVGHRFAEHNGYAQEHRLVYENTHQCCLLSWAVIHHKNDNKLDNRPENLEGMIRGIHMKHHYRGVRRLYYCRDCLSTNISSQIVDA